MENLPFTLEDLEKKPVEHYLGYHTVDTMGYEFYDEDVQPFTLVTSNQKEADAVSCWSDWSKNGFIWVIEGRKAPGIRSRQYFLQEIFQPYKPKRPAVPQDYAGAKKDFEWQLEGVGIPFEDKILLNDLPWFPDFKKRNGSFGFGLRLLRDEAVKAEFIRLAQMHWPQ